MGLDKPESIKCVYCLDTGIAGILVNGEPDRDVCDQCDAFEMLFNIEVTQCES